VPLSVLEPMTVPPASLPKALHDISSGEHLSEVVIVSTCLRTEVYTAAHRYHPAVGDIRNFLSMWSGLPPEDFSDGVYEYYDDLAVAHLFRVSAGLDSAVLGEGEILGQLRDAWQSAQGEGAVGPVLSVLFRQALEVGKRVRSETAIARGTTSLSQTAVSLAASELGSLRGLTTLVVGAGEMGEGMAQALAGGLEAGPLLVANRTWARAVELAARCGGHAVEWSDLRRALTQADVVLACTGATETLLTASDVEAVLDERQGRPMLIVDLAVPRDVDPAVGALAGVSLLDIEDISAYAEEAMEGRRREVPHAEAIVAEEVSRYEGLSAERQVAPLIASLHERAEDIRNAELARLSGRLSGLDETQRRAVEALSHRIVAKLLHQPTVALKSGVGTPNGEQLAQAMRQLFDL
jgi:glutamyl-tRNA reductase